MAGRVPLCSTVNNAELSQCWKVQNTLVLAVHCWILVSRSTDQVQKLKKSSIVVDQNQLVSCQLIVKKCLQEIQLLPQLCLGREFRQSELMVSWTQDYSFKKRCIVWISGCRDSFSVCEWDACRYEVFLNLPCLDHFFKLPVALQTLAALTASYGRSKSQHSGALIGMW